MIANSANVVTLLPSRAARGMVWWTSQKPSPRGYLDGFCLDPPIPLKWNVMSKHILVVAPHPDDADLVAAATCIGKLPWGRKSM